MNRRNIGGLRFWQACTSKDEGRGEDRMNRLGVFIGENWLYFEDICADLQRHYTVQPHEHKTPNVPLLYGRLNRWAYKSGIRSMLRRNDVCFFEFASELLIGASGQLHDKLVQDSLVW